MSLSNEIIDCAPHRWRILRGGTGPEVLCLHGAGASADSFEPLFGHLKDNHSVTAPDLPGHGDTRLGRSHRSGLDAMTEDIGTLAQHLGVQPEIIIGHSAGGAIALMLAQTLKPKGLFLINAALGTFQGLAGVLFPAMARGLAAAPFVPDMAAAMLRSPNRVQALLESTGTTPTEDITTRYARLVRRPEHVSGALRMMAAWRLDSLDDSIRTIATPTFLLTGKNDSTVPAKVSATAAKRLPNGAHVSINGGHLLHEEAPEAVANALQDFIATLSSDASSRIYPEPSDGE